MIFWEGWLLSQYDAVSHECFLGYSFGMESSDAGSVAGAGGQVSRCLGAGSNACIAAPNTIIQTTLIKQTVARWPSSAVAGQSLENLL